MASTKIRIAARLRPRITGEIEDDTVNVQVDEDGASYITVAHPRDPAQRFKFRFTSCYGQTSTQQEIFERDVQPLLDVIYGGVTVTVFAYGVTSSGKTHTMQGIKSDPGIIPRVVQHLLLRSNNIPRHTVSYSMSYMEIYKDEVYDLLVERDTARKLPVRENDVGQVFVANLTFQAITTPKDFDRVYSVASRNRSTGATNLNRASSRSHAILTIVIHIIDHESGKTLTGKINLVDLAGSENNKLTGNDASRMAESSAINKSLSVLGQVVHALNQGATRIPYRDSKLTRILQDALGGSAVGLLICNLAPGAKWRGDTWNTINFATRTKEIENKPVVNIRDTKPPPKPHFAALAMPGVAGPKASLTLPQITNDNAATAVPLGPGPSRPSLVGQNLQPPTKLPAPRGGRLSMIPNPIAGYQFQSFMVPSSSANSSLDVPGRDSNGVRYGMSEKEIDERISKAVEQEVAKRLELRERELQLQRDKIRCEAEAEAQEQFQKQQSFTQGSSFAADITAVSSTPPPESLSQMLPNSTSLPSGVLTPLLKRHQDLDDELKSRLQELEQRHERENKELKLADVLSPVSKKKTGRAYVALARAHSEKGDLQVALDLYRKAASYVPENEKLRERIIEVEWAVRNDVDFVPEPKKKRRSKNGRTRTRKHSGGRGTRRSQTGRGARAAEGIDSDDSEAEAEELEVEHGVLEEATNMENNTGRNSTGPAKRRRRRAGAVDDNVDYDDEGGNGEDDIKDTETQTPKRQKRNRKARKKVVCGDSSDVEILCDVPYAPVRRSKKGLLS